jgi:hypothetical protein
MSRQIYRCYIAVRETTVEAENAAEAALRAAAEHQAPGTWSVVATLPVEVKVEEIKASGIRTYRLAGQT